MHGLLHYRQCTLYRLYSASANATDTVHCQCLAWLTAEVAAGIHKLEIGNNADYSIQ